MNSKTWHRKKNTRIIKQKSWESKLPFLKMKVIPLIPELKKVLLYNLETF